MSESNFQQTIFPRACGVAERLWSSSTVTDINDAQNRLDVQSCRMHRRGINSGPVNPGFCLTVDDL